MAEAQGKIEEQTKLGTLESMKERLTKFLTRYPGPKAPPDQKPVAPVAPLINPESKTPLQDIRDRETRVGKLGH